MRDCIQKFPIREVLYRLLDQYNSEDLGSSQQVSDRLADRHRGRHYESSTGGFF